jgi:hypothetical protein
MNLSKMIAEVRTAREQVEQTILVLERMAARQSRKTGKTTSMDDAGEATEDGHRGVRTRQRRNI